MVSSTAIVSVLVASVVAVPVGSASAKSIGVCPRAGGYELTSLEDLGIPPEDATGIPSLDGNGDGLTCVKSLSGPNEGVIIFRDNTVPA